MPADAPDHVTDRQVEEFLEQLREVPTVGGYVDRIMDYVRLLGFNNGAIAITIEDIVDAWIEAGVRAESYFAANAKEIAT